MCTWLKLVPKLLNINFVLQLYFCCTSRVAFRKLRKEGGQICEQGSFEGAGNYPCAIGTWQTRGAWGHASPGNF